MTLKLYSMAYQDRSDRVRWLLEEMNIPYTNHFLNKDKGEMNTHHYRSINPMGRVPTVVDGDQVLFESAAICMTLADKYGLGKLAPHFEEQAMRAEYTKWMIFSVGSLECVIARMFTHVSTPDEKAETEKYVCKESELFKMVLNPILSKQDYILSSGFSAADIMLGAVIPGAHDYLVKDNPPIASYMDRLMKRDAAIRAKVF